MDATAYIARVVLDDSVTLGALTDNGNKDIKVGEIVVVNKGSTKTIYAYNGDTSGSITFTLAFRNALQLKGAVLLGLLSALVMYSSF